VGEKETLAGGQRQAGAASGIAIGEEGVQRAAAEGEGGAIAIDEEGDQRASNLNLSKSNIDRLAGSADPGGPDPTEATNLNSSKSN